MRSLRRPEQTCSRWLPADRRLKILLGDRLFFQEQHADFFVEIAHLLHKVLIGLFGKGLLLGRDLDDLISRAELVVVGVDDRLLI